MANTIILAQHAYNKASAENCEKALEEIGKESTHYGVKTLVGDVNTGMLVVVDYTKTRGIM